MAGERRRRSIRLRGYDYAAPGAYFVTICTHGRASVLGKIIDGVMDRSDRGQIVADVWGALADHYPHVSLDAFAVMPNHVHGIIIITDNVGAGFKPAPTSKPARHPLPEIIRAFKTFSARRINETRNTPGTTVWQRGYYERIIRDEDDLNRIRQYIADNPAHWATDAENPAARSHAAPDGRQRPQQSAGRPDEPPRRAGIPAVDDAVRDIETKYLLLDLRLAVGRRARTRLDRRADGATLDTTVAANLKELGHGR